MDKLLDLFLKTPLARRYFAGAAERGLILLLGIVATWLQLDPAAYQSDVAKFAAEAAPYIAAAALFVLAQKRMKKAEVTIEAARVLPGNTPRPLVDATVVALMKKEPAPSAREPVVTRDSAGLFHIEPSLTDAELARIADGIVSTSAIVQAVPPGTVDRTD